MGQDCEMSWPSLFLLVLLLQVLQGCGQKDASKAGKNSADSKESGQPLKPVGQGDIPTDPEERYKTAYVRAAQAFSKNDLEGALQLIEVAELAKPNQASNENLRGAVFTRKRDWPKAEEAFKKALALQPDLPMAQFNLGEVLFLNNNYPAAKERFQIFLNSQPSNDLGRYKMYLCDLLGGDSKKAEKFLGELQPNPASPIYYFANAAAAFYKNDKAAALELVGSAYRIYPPDANSTYADSLVEKGYLTGEQNQNTAGDENKTKANELKSLLPGIKREQPSEKSSRANSLNAIPGMDAADAVNPSKTPEPVTKFKEP